ncbi:MAG: sigma-70 family RNA polymerase sigma factor [Cyclobacteriaceae bacterium]
MKVNLHKAISPSPLHVSTEKVEKVGKVEHGSWEEFKNGNEEAFIQIYQENFTSLYRYGSQYTVCRDLIKDTIQELFIDLRKNRKRLSIKSIKPYLFVAFRQNLIAKLKQSNKVVTFDSDLLEGYDFKVEISSDRMLIDSQDKDYEKERLNRVIDSLPTRQKEIIYLFYFEDMSYEEIKQLMSFKDIKSVRNLVYKAIKSLRANYVSS